MVKCKYCRDEIEDSFEFQCDCKCPIKYHMCIDCHNEVMHNKVKIQNVNIGGNVANTGLSSVDKDPDAYTPSWRNR